MTAAPITRFAPSPTGPLHLGHAYAAFVISDWAKANGAQLRLRIEDIDPERCRPAFEAALIDDLKWLGLEWTGPVWRQSERLSLYRDVIEQLGARGLVYRCFRTRRDIAEALSAPHKGPDASGAFTGAPLSAAEEAARLSRGEPFAWRLSLKAAEASIGVPFSTLMVTEETDAGQRQLPCQPEAFGDVILGRKDSGTSYHLSAVVDDIESGITNVIRGNDLAQTAHLHRLLYGLLGAVPPTYRHHRLILGADGKRLSKRDAAKALRTLRDAKETPASLRAALGLSA